MWNFKWKFERIGKIPVVKEQRKYFEEKIKLGQELSATEMLALKNRRLLFHALRSVGLTNYHREWWHFDFGNQLWAVQENTAAIYGKASLS